MIATVTDNNKTAWLGEFPTHWEVLRIKNLFQEMDSRSETGSEELLSVSHYTGVTLKRESLENEDDHLTNADSLVGYKLVQQGDLVINIMLAWNGSLGISPHNGMTSPAYCVYRIKGDNNPEYFGYLFTTNLFKAEFRRNSTGIIDSRLRLYSDKFFSIFTVVPPKDEQDEIVQYIKAQEEKINLFIQKKKRFIELLKEQRRNIINKCVTKGLNPNIKFKASGFEWLGDIPIHWEKRRLKNIGVSKYGLGQPPKEKEGGLPLIRATNIDAGNITEKNLIFVDPLDIPYDRDPVLKVDDIIVVRSGALTGDSAIITEKYQGAITGYDMVFETQNGYAEFVGFYLLSPFALSQIYLLRQRAAQPHLNKEELENLIIGFPPMDEQKQIVAHIKTETDTIDTAIAKTEREIELIQ